MPAQGQKGKRRRKPAKPYDKPKGFMTKVKDFLNPWAWSKPFDKAAGETPVNEEDVASMDSDSDKFESAPSSPVEGEGGVPSGGAGDFGGLSGPPSVPQYHASNDPRYISFKSKADIGSLSTDVLSDQRMQSIFGNVNSEAPRSIRDISSQAVMPSDISTRATAGSDSSSQPSISEVDPNETGSVSSIVGGAVAKGDKLGESSLSRKYLSTSLAFGNRGRLSLFTPHSSIQSLRERQGTSQRRSFLADSSISANLFTSTPRVAEERRGHQVATPLTSLQPPQSSAGGSTAQGSGTAEEDPLTRESPSPSLPAFVTPTRQRSSLSRTPFNSPFYQSGRTPYFGTGQKKRGRPESPSSPELPPLRQKATAKPLASTSATTQTAKKILQALESISSPLENVRRLPPRLPVQPSAKRRKAELPDALAPPTDPLQSAVPVRLLPTFSTTPQQYSSASAAPINMQRSGGTLPNTSISTQPPLQPSLFTVSANPPRMLSSTSPPGVLAGSKPPALTTQGRRRGAVTGKMTSPRRQQADGQFSSPLDNNNPLELPPPIPLLGLKSAPKLNIATTQPSTTQFGVTSANDSLKMAPPPPPLFSSTLGAPSLSRTTNTHGTILPPPSSLSHPSMTTTATTKLTIHVSGPKASSHGNQVTPPKATPSTALGGPFTFAPPTQMSPARVTIENCNKPFVFSPPQVRVGVSAPTTTPFLPTTNKGTPVQLPKSALDALSQFKEAGEKMAAEDEANPDMFTLSSDDEDNEDKSASAVNLTSSSKEKETSKWEQKPLVFKPLSHLPPPTGSWSCDTCLINNKEGDIKCCACGAAKPGVTKDTKSSPAASSSTALKLPPSLGAPAAQWTCDTCLVPNKEDAEQCVCCGTKKPGSAPAKLAAPPMMPPLAPAKPLALLDKGEGGDQWTCDACLVPNKSSDSKCVCCGGGKPGEKVESKAASSVSLGPAGGLKLNFPVSTSNSGGLKLNFPVATSSSGAGVPLGGAGGLKLNFPILKAETSTAASSTEGPKLSTGGVGFGLKFPMATTSTSTVTSGEPKLSTGGLKFSTGGLGAFAQAVSSSSGVGDPQKADSSGSAVSQKSVTFKLDEDARGEQGGAQKETRQDAVKGPAPTSSTSSETPGHSAEGGMKLGGVGGLPLTAGVKLAGAQLDKGESGGGAKLGGVAMTTLESGGRNLKLGGGLVGPGGISKLGTVTTAKSDLGGSIKAGGLTTTPSLSGGLKLGDVSSSSSPFVGANLSFSNNSNVAASGGLKLDGGFKFGGDLKLLPATTATVSKETASGVPAMGGLGSSGPALGLEGVQQSSSVGFAFGADGMKPGLLSQSTPSTEAKGSSSGLVFGGLSEGASEQKAATSSAGLQVPSFLSSFQKEGTNLFATSLKSGASSEQKLSNASPLKAAASSSGVPTLGGGGLFSSPGVKPFTLPAGGTAPQLALSSLSSTPSTAASGLPASTQGGGLFLQPPMGLQLPRNAELSNAGTFGLSESKPLQGVNTGPVGVSTATFQFGSQGSSAAPAVNPFAASLAPAPQQSQPPPPLSSNALNFFGQPSAANTQQPTSGGFAGGLALGGPKPLGGGGGGGAGLFSGLQVPSTLPSSTSAGAAPTFKFGEANPNPNFAFGSGNANPLLSHSAENPFLSSKSPSATLGFEPTNTAQGANMFSAAATKNSRIVKRAVRRGKR